MTEIKIANKVEEIGRISREFHQFAEQHALPYKTVYEIDLLLEEILLNIINYGFKDENPHEVEVKWVLRGDFFHLTIVDDGVAFNLLEKADPDLDADIDERKIGGLGIHLIKKIADYIDYQRIEDKNVLIFEKKINNWRRDGNQTNKEE